MESESHATIITANRYPIYLDWIIVKAVQLEQRHRRGESISFQGKNGNATTTISNRVPIMATCIAPSTDLDQHKNPLHLQP